MPTTTTARSRRRPRSADFPPLGRGGGFALAAAALLLLAAADEPPSRNSRPVVMMMTGLPLVWGEKGPFDAGSRAPTAYHHLRFNFRIRPVDVLDSKSLDRGRLLFLAQPHRLAPAELAALDSWIRGGGRALILTDPMLTWPSELPPGDIRRPRPVGLLAPLLDHWGLTLTGPETPGEVEAAWNGARIVMDSPGRLRSSSSDCAVAPGGWTALCRLGRGAVRVVADADLLRDSAWAPNGLERPVADNPEIVGEWLDSLAGTPRPRRRLARDPVGIWRLGGPGPASGRRRCGNRTLAAPSPGALTTYLSTGRTDRNNI